MKIYLEVLVVLHNSQNINKGQQLQNIERTAAQVDAQEHLSMNYSIKIVRNKSRKNNY